MRLDLALVHQKLIDTRTKAKTAIQTGLVFYQGQLVLKPSQEITHPEDLEIRGTVCPYASRGGLKLEKAIHSFSLDLTDKIVLDIGASTGGFTDCALKHGAKKVIAVDVGKNQLVLNLRQNKSVVSYEQTDFRTIDLAKIEDCSIAISDVSFISATKMISKLNEMPNLTDFICLIKPQFECGKQIAKKYQGVIKDKTVHQTVLKKIIKTFGNSGFYLHNLTFSPIQGGSGNIEYLAHFTKKESSFHVPLAELITQAFQQAI